MKIKRLTKGVVLTLTDAEVGDLFAILGCVDSRGLRSKREVRLMAKLGGLSEAITGRKIALAVTDEQRASPEHQAAAQATRGLWSTVRV